VKRSRKVFVVDDDLAVLESLKAVLTANGYSVECFTSAEDFLENHHPTQVGCVLVDLLMPGMGGSELLRRLREAGSLLSVVVVTGLFDKESLDVQESASVLLLESPYEPLTLLTMVEDGIAASMRRRGKGR
jgi:FixJ family two-component response regulator